MPKSSRRFWQLPDAQSLQQQAWLQKFGPRLHAPALWRLRRRSLQRACLIGIFCAWLPLPIQMLLAGALAVRFQAHLPLTLGLVWLNNPLTLPLLIVAGYQAGVVILQQSAQPFVFEASWQWFASSLQQVGLPLLLGSVVLGMVSALLSWPLSAWFWQYRVKRLRAAQRQKWQQRRAS